jgi:hypothetical protein
MVIEGYFAFIGLLVVMVCAYILGRMRGYRKAAKRYKTSNAPRTLNNEDLGMIVGIVRNALSQVLGYNPDCDEEIDDTDDGLAQQLCIIGADWVRSVQDALQMVKYEIISEIIDRTASDNTKLQDHITQEIKAQDKRAIKRESMRAARAKGKAETPETEMIETAVETIEAGLA